MPTKPPFDQYIKVSKYLTIIAGLFNLFIQTTVAKDTDHCIQTYTQDRYIHIAKINLQCPNLEFIGSQSSDKGITVSNFAKKYHTHVAINANFYWKDFTPIGLVITDYKQISKYSDVRSRVIFACDAKHHCTIEPRNQTTKIHPKWKIAISGWQSYHVNTGKFECALSDKVGCVQDIFTSKHPRTLLGIDEKRHLLYLVVVEGRQLTFRGMTLDELAQLAQALELTKAINLDGGSSSTMVVGNKRLSALPFLQSEERKIANHFGVKLAISKGQ